jgi:hypothetical protein
VRAGRRLEAADEVFASFGEVGPSVVVGRDYHGGTQDGGGGCGADAVHADRAVAELARDAGGAGVQHGHVNVGDALGDLRAGADGGVITAEIDNGQVSSASGKPT